MSSELVRLTTISQIYDPPPYKKSDNSPIDKTKTSIPPPTNGIHIEKHVLDAILWTHECTIWKSVFNPSTHDT